VITRSLKLPGNVRALSSRGPETIVDERLGVAVHGQSFPTRAVTDDLSARYPAARADLFNLGVLHTCLTGRAGHDPYAPTTLDALKAKGYDYWALGHVHAREILCQDPYIVFPGNLQGRHVRETGAKGATLVTCEAGRVIRVEHRPTDVVRWAHCEVDAGPARSAEDALELVRAALVAEAAGAAGPKPVAARVTLFGAARAHAAFVADPEKWTSEIRALATEVGAWVEKVLFKTRAPLDLQALAERGDALGQLVQALAELREDAAAQSEVLAALKERLPRLPPELQSGEDAVRLDDPERARALFGDVEQLLLSRLTEGGRP
jgi:DNA repair exonuclease SbcCD nuclease subunit